MCVECGFTVCVSGCPNAPEPVAVHRCKYCDEPITVGEEYYEFEGEQYHEECFYDIAVTLLMKAGAERRTASEDDIDDGSDDFYEDWRDRMHG